MTKFLLSNLNIVGSIDQNTPYVVLKECFPGIIDENRNMCISQIRDYINSNPAFSSEIILPLSDDGFPVLAKFINENVNWTKNSLYIVFDRLQKFMLPIDQVNQHYYCDLLENLKIGKPTPQEPERLSICCIYRICKLHNLKTSFYTTVKQMEIMVKFLHKNPQFLRNKIQEECQILNSRHLVHLLSFVLIENDDQSNYENVNMLIPNEIETSDSRESEVSIETSDSLESDSFDLKNSDNIRYDNLVECFNNFDNKSYLQKRIQPNTEIEACVLAALNYRYDLTSAKYPIYEYQQLNLCESTYIPSDPNMIEKFRDDEYSYRIDYTFNPHLPRTFYTDVILKDLAIEEGFVNEDFRRDDPYELLQYACLSKTFYHGKYPTIINSETPILYESVKELDSAVCICYGVKNESLIAFTYIELAKYFDTECNFLNPCPTSLISHNSITNTNNSSSRNMTELFELRSIRKLKKLCKYIRCTTINDGREILYETIMKIEVFLEEKGLYGLQLLRTYQKSQYQEKIIFEKIFNSLFELCMYMRGWIGYGEYPITDAPVDNQNDVDLRVTEAMIKFEQICTETPKTEEISKMILDLPLLRYRDNTFSAISDENQGCTIGERIKLVKQGENIDVIISCIRISSNLLAASYYRYCDILGLPTPFEIKDLRSIQ